MGFLKTVGMMRCIVTYHDMAKKAILESSGDHKISWNIVYNQTKPLYIKLSQMKFEVGFNKFDEEAHLP